MSFPNAIAYTVTAVLPDAETADMYEHWLCGGHMQAVVAGGATEACVSRLVEPNTTIEVEARYLFPNPDAFDRYVVTMAPILRAEGLAKFGDRVRFGRRVAEVIGRVR